MNSTNPDNNEAPLRATLRDRLRWPRLRPRKLTRMMVAVMAGLVLVLAVGGSTLYANFTTGLPDITALDKYDPATTSKVFAADGTLIATLFDENRTYVKIDKIAPVMVSALVAIEDRRFFQHEGVDLKGIGRALLGNTTSGETEQGASTLTMQLARRLFLTEERTYARKVREAVLAYRIDRTYSKEKVLELYLNEVYFGGGAYGIDAAASMYFGLNPNELELWQAAMLAGLVQAPTSLSPLVDRKAALARTDEVLEAMVSVGDITSAQAKQAAAKADAYRFVDRPVVASDGLLKYPYFTTYVIRQLAEQFPDRYVRRGGLRVYTTLDPALQEKAEKELTRALRGPGLAAGADTGAVVVIDNVTGNLLAMVGGPGWSKKKQYNAAWQARRQPGSAFKMFIYAAALEAGYNPEHEFADTEATFSPGMPEQWSPKNSDGAFMGAIPMRTGLQFSRNLVAAKILAHVGPDRVVTLAHKLGVDSDLPRVASLALGAGEVTPLQMARAFSALPSGGIQRPVYAISKVTTSNGEILKSFSGQAEEKRVLSQRTATQMCEMLRRVVTGGTAPAAGISGTYVAGKTGTTDNFKDAWFAGFTPHHTLAVWIGRDDNKPMNRVYGGTIPAEVFQQVAKAALTGKNASAPLPGVSFEQAQTVALCWDSTYLATGSCARTYSDVFQAGLLPSRECPMHRQVVLPQTVTLTSADPAGDPALAANGKAQGDPALSVSRPVAYTAIPDNLNPRRDPEVVGPQSAKIPYQEAAPSMAGLKVLVKAKPKTTTRVKPGEGQPADGEFRIPEDTLSDGTAGVGEAPSSADQDPAFDTGGGSAPASAPTSAPIEVEPAYPTATIEVEPAYPTAPADLSTVEEPMAEPESGDSADG